MNILDDLNEAQATAVAGDGPLSIVAGPGTGKTKTLTARVVHLVQNGTPPERILALTFTNKAAREMQARVGAVLENAAATPDVPHITTFHGLCYELLGDGAPMQIIGEADRLELLRELRSQHATELPLREIAAKISLAKNNLGAQDSTIATLLQKYNEALRGQNHVDFDDLLRQVHARLSNDKTFRANVQSRWQYVLVDEFQDTNELQYALLKMLASHDNFFAIGDPLQSIYGFRGATGDIFQRFAQDFPGVRRITLTANYRSRPEIVAAANALFRDAPQLIAQTQTPGIVEAVAVLNEYREAEWIVQAIEADLGGTDFERSHRVGGSERARKFGDYAVLYRTHRVARALKRAFDESGLPFQCVGDDSPYSGRSLRIATAVLRRATLGAAALPPTEHRLLAKLPRKTLDKLTAQVGLPPTKFLQLAAQQLALIKNENAARELHQALGALVRFDHLTAKDFLQKFDELAEVDFFDQGADAVTLMTIHASKGLEFAHVFIIAGEDGVLPHGDPDTQDLAEERRLLYVAMTRAREHLTILHAGTRNGQPAQLSQFLTVLDAGVLPHSAAPNLQTQTIAAQKRKAKNAQGSLF